jgi:hypothetical protein
MNSAFVPYPEGNLPADLWATQVSGTSKGIFSASESALVQLTASSTNGFQYWLTVGAAKDHLEELSMNFSGANRPAGKAYNKAFDELIEHMPRLKKLHEKDKGTVSRALWMHRNRAALEEWHGNLEEHEQLRCNHPRIVKERFERRDELEFEDAEGKKDQSKQPKDKKPSRADLLQRELDQIRAYVIELESENERLAGEKADLSAQYDELLRENEALVKANRQLHGKNTELTGRIKNLATAPIPGKPSINGHADPEPRRGRRKPDYPWMEIKIGEWFDVPGGKQSNVAVRASYYLRAYHRRFTTTKLDNAVRVTRTA